MCDTELSAGGWIGWPKDGSYYSLLLILPTFKKFGSTHAQMNQKPLPEFGFKTKQCWYIMNA